MPLPIDPTRSTLPAVAQFLAEAALQRQSGLLGLDKTPGAAAARFPVADPSAPPSSATSTSPTAGPLPAPADKAIISPQAREQLGAGFEPARAAVGASGAQSSGPGGRPLGSASMPLTTTGAAAAGAQGAATVAAAAWPAGGLSAPLLRMVSALIAQLTQSPQGAAPQRVLAAQAWPLDLAHALESGAVDGDAPVLQTWLVRQGSVQASDGARGFALTLRAPVAWLAGQPPSPAAPPAGAAPLRVPFGGGAATLQSGVLALVLQGAEASATRTNLTSALLVLDFQPLLATTVYGRDMLLTRHDPWLQLAQLQASGQLPKDEALARDREVGLCHDPGCPYAGRATCAQPFCLALSVVAPVAALDAGPGSVGVP